MNLPFALPFMGNSTARRGKVPNMNLYPEDPFYQTIVGKTLRWAVSAGRHIVIFTEVIVIGSFFSRFVLDRQLTDLNRSIFQKQAIVQGYGELEDNIRSIQRRTKDISQILEQQGRYEVLDILIRITPTDVVYESIGLQSDKLSLQGRALSNQSLGQLIDALKREKDFQNVSVNEIQSGDSRDPGVSFSITVTYIKGILEFEREAS